jgi:hypothetical protein
VKLGYYMEGRGKIGVVLFASCGKTAQNPLVKSPLPPLHVPTIFFILSKLVFSFTKTNTSSAFLDCDVFFVSNLQRC